MVPGVTFLNGFRVNLLMLAKCWQIRECYFCENKNINTDAVESLRRFVSTRKILQEIGPLGRWISYHLGNSSPKKRPLNFFRSKHIGSGVFWMRAFAETSTFATKSFPFVVQHSETRKLMSGCVCKIHRIHPRKTHTVHLVQGCAFYVDGHTNNALQLSQWKMGIFRRP